MSDTTNSGRPQMRPTARPRHPPIHRLEYALVRSLERAVSALPERAADAFGASLGRAALRMGVRRDVVSSNLRMAFPDKPDEWIAKIERAAYEHLGREAVSMLRLSRLDPGAVIERTTTVGWEEMMAARSLGRGVILVSGHFGNWEIAAAAVAARGVPIAAIVRRQGNRMVDERLQRLRNMLGVETIYQSQASSRVPRILRANGVVGIVGDQDAREKGIFVPFFGRPASTHRGTALFALRLDAPVLSCIAHRMPGKDIHYEVRGEPIAVERTGDMEADVLTLTAKLARKLEDQVRMSPEQYFWFHKRWKTQPAAVAF